MINVSIDTTTVEGIKRELINQLKSKINQAHIETVCREQYGINSIEGYECIDGDLVIDNDQVAFKLDFEVRFPVSLLINTDGNNDTTSSEDDVILLSKYNSSLELIEPEESDEVMDDELPDIDFKDM